MGSRTRRGGFALALCALAAACAVATATASELSGETTLDRTLSGDPNVDFSFLSSAGGESYLTRTDLGTALTGRDQRRNSLIYFGQLSDFQLTDEESPSRVEFFDAQPAVNFSSSGHRPQEALLPHEVDAMIRQINSLGQSPVAQGDGSSASMANVIATGDLADSMQRNETEWVLRLLEGGDIDPNSGTGDNPLCAPPLTDDPAGYTGVQDYDDYVEGNLFWDPDSPVGQYAQWPDYANLQDRAQDPFTAAGLNVPSHVAVGNHDVLVQGNEDANVAFETVATGCVKPFGPFPSVGPSVDSALDILDPTYLAGLLTTNPTALALVPPDANRQYVNKAQQRAIFAGGSQADGHGFGYVDPAELAASNGAALYYSFSPKPGIRMIALDTNTTGSGLLIDPATQNTTAEGNIDDPQWQWLETELDAAEAADELVITYAHHATASMDYTIPDEGAVPCTPMSDDGHGHDVNPGCDLDPRSSSPLHFGDDLVDLLNEHPNVISHVAGHSHENEVIPHDDGAGGGFWEIKSPAIADWPAQSRLLEVMDNGDGTLSIFGTLIDSDAPVTSEATGTDADTLDREQLASLGRTISFNDFQAGGTTSAAGELEDRNVELLLDDPRTTQPGGGSGGTGDGGGGSGGQQNPPAGRCATVRSGTPGADALNGSAGGDLIRGLRGPDQIVGRGGDDCLYGNKGRDRIFGGAGSDLLSGGNKRDRLVGGSGADIMRAGSARDRVEARDGVRDRINCGSGRDTAIVDKADRVKGCERVRRR